MRIVITGAAGFIGSRFSEMLLERASELGYDDIVILDALTYSGRRENMESVLTDPRVRFVHASINDQSVTDELLNGAHAVVHFAAESHVDRSIESARAFFETNVLGTQQLLESARRGQVERFVHVSTDEVYGSLSPTDPAFTEAKQYEPNSPYSASKAASDHLVRAYHHTYGLPVLTTNCSNNYGPYHFPEKLIPLIIHNALAGKSLPIYGDGQQVRDWLYVKDHASAIRRVLEAGKAGETYNVGGWNEKPNLDVVHTLCAIMDELSPRSDGKKYAEQITYVTDRPGHDRRYAIDATKINRELGWKPAETFETGIRKTVQWYLDNRAWVSGVTSGAYKDWVQTHYLS